MDEGVRLVPIAANASNPDAIEVGMVVVLPPTKSYIDWIELGCPGMRGGRLVEQQSRFFGYLTDLVKRVWYQQ